MANEINATNINEAIDKLEAEAENIEPIDDVLVKAAKAYVKTAYKEQYEIERLGLVMSEDKWNGYDLLDAFKAGVEWQRIHVWHEPSECPEIAKLFLEIRVNEGICYGRHYTPNKNPKGKWAYIEDLLPSNN